MGPRLGVHEGVSDVEAHHTEDGDDAGNDGNLSSDPNFQQGYYLASGSPCIDAGTNAVYLVGAGYTTGVDDSDEADGMEIDEDEGACGLAHASHASHSIVRRLLG